MSELKQILLVEDELDIQIIARMALQKLGGYSVEVCSSGQEALEKVISYRPDVILLDVMMPGLDGPGTLKALRQPVPGCQAPVIFMTAKVQPSEVAEYRTLGALDVIAKPFDPMGLAALVASIWNKARD